MLSSDTGRKLRKTKIVCTLGPSSESEAVIRRMIQNGMSVARLNFSHGDYDSHTAVLEQVRAMSERVSQPVGVMVDVPGPKYRTGRTYPVELDIVSGSTVTLTSRDIIGDRSIIPVAPAGIHRDAQINRRVLINDGLIELRVDSISGEDVRCRVMEGGEIEATGRGVVIPDVVPSLPFFDDRAEEALAFAAEKGAEFVAVSNVTTADDIESTRKKLVEHGTSECFIISKIERPEAIEKFDSILEASDGVMVARGDMGVEIDPWLVPGIQKKLIAKANAVGKPVITATQMLLSMVNSTRATRAESSDVFNAVLDGSDAVMLSEETAAGKYPAHVVRVMARLALEAESDPNLESLRARHDPSDESPTDEVVSFGAVRMADQLDASLIVAFTESGSTASRVSRYRPNSPILALTPYERVSRLLTLRWGVMPAVVKKLETGDDIFGAGLEQARKTPGVEPGGTIVLVAGLPMGTQGSTNLLHIMEVDGE